MACSCVLVWFYVDFGARDLDSFEMKLNLHFGSRYNESSAIDSRDWWGPK